MYSSRGPGRNQEKSRKNPKKVEVTVLKTAILDFRCSAGTFFGRVNMGKMAKASVRCGGGQKKSEKLKKS
jgi:hypothetical protein